MQMPSQQQTTATEQTMISRMGLTTRLILALTFSGGLIFAVVFSFNYKYTSEMVERQVMAHAQDVVKAAAVSIDGLLSGIARDEARLAAQLEKIERLSPRQVREMLYNHLLANDEVFGATAAFEPGAFSGVSGQFAPYYYRRVDGSIAYSDLATPTYNYPEKEWYRTPKELRSPSWSEPYFDEGGGNVVMTTYSIPLYRTQGDSRHFSGVVTADLSVDWLGKQLSSLQLYRNGYAALFSRKGVYLSHPDRSLVLKETVFTVSEKVGSPMLKEIGQAIARQENGFVKGENIYGIESWIYYAPVPSTGWSLAVVFPASEMQTDVYEASRMIALICAGGFLVLVLSILLVANSITGPIRGLTDAVRLIAAGNLDAVLPPVRTGGEIGDLAAAFVRMQGDLKEYINRLTETTAAKERMASELAIAHDLQMSILPQKLPDIPGIRMFAHCRPAREVGGDLYDVRQLSDGRIFFMIGDVSGKGVPAALYMSITVSLARAVTQEVADPAVILSRINNELSRDNDSCMFVTIFCGILDPATGDIIYANAGHNPPVIATDKGAPRLLEIEPNLVAGCMGNYCFTSAQCRLEPGATLLLYTDGVTEALDREGNFFGEEQMLQTIAESDGTPEGMTKSLDARLAVFSEGTSQADDITLLAITYFGKT